MSVPQQSMRSNIKPVHSFMGAVHHALPGTRNRIQVGLEAGWGVYASQRKMQTFVFSNGNSTLTGVNYNSNAVQAGLFARVLLNKNKLVTPYVSGKAGYTSFYSNIFVEDPLDLDGCAPLQQSNIIKDGTMTGAYGAGLLIDLDVFGNKSGKKDFFIDLSVQHVRGGNINYINTKKLIDANNPPVGSDGKPLMVSFINASTQEIHEHQVAEVFTTPLRLLECKVSFVFKL